MRMAWNSRTLGAFALSTAVAAAVTTGVVSSKSHSVAPDQPTKASTIEAASSTPAEDARRSLVRAEMRLARYDAAKDRLIATLSDVSTSGTADLLAQTRTEIDAAWTEASETLRVNLDTQFAAIANEQALTTNPSEIEQTVEHSWELFAVSTDTTLAQVINANAVVTENDSVLDSLDSALQVAARDANLNSTPSLVDATAAAHNIALALADAAQSASAISETAMHALTDVLVQARAELQDASETYALNHPHVPLLTNVTPEEYALNGRNSNMTVPSANTIQALSPTSDYIMYTGRQALAAQSGEVSAGDGGAAPATAAPAATESAAPIRSVTATNSSSMRATDAPQAYDPNDPLNQIHNIYFKDMDTFNAIDLLAKKANLNVVGGPALTGTVNANMSDVPLGRAMEIILEVHGMGMIREGNIIRIVTLEEALATHRVTQIVYLDKAKATDIATTLQNSLSGGINSSLVSIAPNDTTNVLLIAGPPGRVQELVELTQQLDIAEPVLPTYTAAIPLNYAEPVDVLPIIEGMLTADIGNAQIDPRTRHVIINDVPAVIEQARDIILSLDNPVKQVAIESMVVDVVLRDQTDLGANILFNLIPETNTLGNRVGDFNGAGVGFGAGTQGIAGNTNPTTNTTGTFVMQLLNQDYNLTAAITAAVASNDAKLLANPVIVTTENKPAMVSITQEFPYQELTQTQQGGNLGTTNFKDIGTTLSVTPRVTHDNNIIVDLEAKESTVSGQSSTGVPIEEAREATGTFMVHDGQTVFVGGLRSVQESRNITKVPILGDIPLLGTAFRTTRNLKVNTELMIFLTCHVLGDRLPDLTPSEQLAHDELGTKPFVPETQGETLRTVIKPNEMRDPVWKWRKAK